jgi:hypothetical protein
MRGDGLCIEGKGERECYGQQGISGGATMGRPKE